MKLIVGLGNPGLKYKSTRHNIGFLAVEHFAKQNKVRVSKKNFHSLFAGKDDFMLLEPHTFMNNSGEAVSAAAEKFGIAAKDILVVCDDVNLPLGTIRIKAQGSAGGHKGLISIIDKLGTGSFNRLRIGIASDKRGGLNLKDYVLSGFSPGEKKNVKESVGKAAAAIAVWVGKGIDTAMNKFN